MSAPTRIYAKNIDTCAETPLAPGEVALNVGCGKKHWSGWVNVDSKDADVYTELPILPFEEDYADRIVAIHVFEHLYPWDGVAFLYEAYRVLIPGGSIALEMPDMEKVLSHIQARMSKGQAPHPTFSWYAIWGDPKYHDPAMCHRWGYFAWDVIRLLKDAGFVDIKQEQPNYHFEIRDMRVTARKPC